MNRPTGETEFDLYVPVDERAAFGIHPGSAIVATASQRGNDHLVVYYEGNLYGSPEMREYAGRCYFAASRASTRYPTVAFARLPKDSLIRVGAYDLQAKRVTEISNAPVLAAWLGGEPVPVV